MRIPTRWLILGVLTAAHLVGAPSLAETPRYDLSSEKVLYCVGYAHLDTQWRWDFAKTIDQFILDTLDQNFERMDKYPAYVFNFTGSVRYQMMKEYYPEKYARLKKYIADGRWFRRFMRLMARSALSSIGMGSSSLTQVIPTLTSGGWSTRKIRISRFMKVSWRRVC